MTSVKQVITDSLVCVALLALISDAPRGNDSTASQQETTIAQTDEKKSADYSAKPNYGDTLYVDINCDGVLDCAFGTKLDSIYELTVVIGPLSDSSKRSTMKIGIGQSEFQDYLCGVDVRLEVEDLYASRKEMKDDLEYVPPGYHPSNRCKGLVVFATDGECDRFHCYWNHETAQIDWWRL